ncbi:Protein of unknown function [Aliiroseovarius sediminilitoris]|uniref:Alpha-1,2-mannosyltransferase n=2 Tax=Aliiroseovarius sediminilitoris TaxID=1173584 RepID=A0A1I0QQY1_9RHOB|nr:Protein of unknown function [Aliiroseovarius sediminilitoris]
MRIAIIIVLTISVLVFANGSNAPIDLASLYIAASFYDDGLYHLIYPLDGDFFWNDIPIEWQERAALSSDGISIVTPYVYPPIWVAILAPVTKFVSFDIFARVVLVINVGSFIGMIWLGFRMLKPRRVLATVWVAVSALLLLITSVSHLSLSLGQPQIFVTFLIMLAFCNLIENKPAGAGGWLALAAAIKVAPALLAIIFLMERNWRALLWFGVLGGMLGGLSILMTGWPLHAEFLDKLRELEGTILVSGINLGMDLPLLLLWQAYNGTLSLETLRIDLWPEPKWILWSVRATFLSGLIVCFFVSRNLEAHKRVWARLLTTSLVLLFTSPLGWLHYLILPMMLLPGILEFSSRRLGILTIAAVAVGYSLPLYFVLSEQSTTFVLQVFLHFILAVLLFTSILIVCVRQSQRS